MAVLNPDLLRQANSFLDSEDLVENATELGERMFAVFGAEKNDRISTQVRNLEQLALSARRLADVEDFVKNQMGRTGDIGAKWRRLGQRLLAQLQTLRENAQTLIQEPEKQNAQTKHELRLYLLRGWVQTVVGAYLYRKALSEMERGQREDARR